MSSVHFNRTVVSRSFFVSGNIITHIYKPKSTNTPQNLETFGFFLC